LAKGVLKWFLYLVSVGLLFLGAIFIISTNLGGQYLLIGIVFTGVALLILYFSRERHALEVKQTLDLSGAPMVKEITCSNCGASLTIDTAQIVAGKPYLTCEYCGQGFELTEEPKW
jgi:uncharacterized membrane protein